MKKIIDGKIYDTENAEEIASFSFSRHGACDYLKEILYVADDRKIFIYGEGGAISKYTTVDDNGEFHGSSTIHAFCIGEMIEWFDAYSDYIELKDGAVNDFINKNKPA